VRTVFLSALFAALVCASGATAHDARPAYLEVTETSTHRYAVLWRTPLLSGTRLPVRLRFPDNVRNVTEPATRDFPDSVVERRLIEATGGLGGQRIEFVGLQGTITDVLVRLQAYDGAQTTILVKPSRPWVEIVASRGPLAVAGAFLLHGIEHILFGFDHLLFVLALMLIVGNWRMLFWTITAFTLAHSITLSLATFGLVRVPGPPVEATIALSILLLACEIIRAQRGRSSLTVQRPWVVAFSFGLLHGFGFASALTEIGLPQADIPLALLTFNLGVEIGQLIFIAAVLATVGLVRRMGTPIFVERHARTAVTYAIGIMAAVWFIERVAGFAA
jgi:hydrogenase/urease accessory protein HupE